MNFITLIIIWVVISTIISFFNRIKKNFNKESSSMEEHGDSKEFEDVIDLPLIPQSTFPKSLKDLFDQSEDLNYDDPEEDIEFDSVPTSAEVSLQHSDTSLNEERTPIDKILEKRDTSLREVSKYSLRSKKDLKRALVWSEILKRKY